MIYFFKELQMIYFKCRKNKSIPWLKGNIISPKGMTPK